MYFKFVSFNDKIKNNLINLNLFQKYQTKKDHHKNFASLLNPTI